LLHDSLPAGQDRRLPQGARSITVEAVTASSLHAVWRPHLLGPGRQSSKALLQLRPCPWQRVRPGGPLHAPVHSTQQHCGDGSSTVCVKFAAHCVSQQLGHCSCHVGTTYTSQGLTHPPGLTGVHGPICWFACWDRPRSIARGVVSTAGADAHPAGSCGGSRPHCSGTAASLPLDTLPPDWARDLDLVPPLLCWRCRWAWERAAWGGVSMMMMGSRGPREGRPGGDRGGTHRAHAARPTIRSACRAEPWHLPPTQTHALERSWHAWPAALLQQPTLSRAISAAVSACCCALWEGLGLRAGGSAVAFHGPDAIKADN